MCGIWLHIGRLGNDRLHQGGLGKGGALGEGPLASMRHRGPDATGFARLEVAGHSIELGHLRLSIIDLDARSNQPMRRDGDLTIVFNGEIYNFIEIRQELERLGQVFATTSDTEALLAAYAVWGTDMLTRLRGMFAFALVDERRGRLLIARDPFGIKPLFIARREDGFSIASEIAPLLEVPGVSRRADASAVAAFLDTGLSDAGTRTFFADIKSLAPAHFAVVDLTSKNLAIEPKRYWRPVYDARISDRAEAAGLVRERFLDSMKLHLRADVPIGSMLSGGIDSSAIVASMRRLLGPSGDLHSFSFVSPGDPLDETAYIRLMAQAAGTIPHEIEAGPEQFAAEIETVARHQGEPFGSTSIYAQYKVAEAARSAGIKVLLDGQGSDELFAGYRFYLGARVAGLLAAGEPLRAGRLLARMAGLPGVRLPSALFHTLTALDVPFAGRLQRRAEARLGPGALVDPAWRSSVAEMMHHGRSLPRRLALLDRLNASLERDVLPALLRFEDRNTMAFSIEARVPFLDVPLAEAACGLAPHLLVDDYGTTKPVLRDALRGLVPDAILDRRDKIGFAAPEARWLKGAAGWVAREIERATPESVPFLQLAIVRDTLPRMVSGQTPWQPWGWRILSLLLWTRIHAVDHRTR